MISKNKYKIFLNKILLFKFPQYKNDSKARISDIITKNQVMPRGRHPEHVKDLTTQDDLFVLYKQNDQQ